MNSRAAQRRDAGVVRGGYTGGARGARDTRLPQTLSAITPGLIKRLARCQPWERDGIRQYLRENGSPKAADVLVKLEQMWAAREAAPRPEPARPRPGLIWLECWVVLVLAGRNEQETRNGSRQRTA